MTHPIEHQRIYISGVGASHPKKCVLNEDLPLHLNTSDEWIQQRTGIKQRYIIDEGEDIVSIASEALLKALKMAGINPLDLDAIILATTTPAMRMPSTASLIQNIIGNYRCTAFDIQVACAGFVTAIQIAYGFIFSGQFSKIAVIGADLMSKIIDWNDRSTCVLFGDGAGAIIIENKMEAELVYNAQNLMNNIDIDNFSKNSFYEKNLTVDYTNYNINSLNNKIISFNSEKVQDLNEKKYLFDSSGNIPQSGNIIDLVSYSHADLKDILYANCDGFITMKGINVFKHAVQELTFISRLLVKRNNLDISDISWVIPHQANKRILDAIASNLDISIDKFVITVNKYANTSAASIPMALDFLYHNGDSFYKRLSSGDLIIMLGVGSGMIFNGILLRW
ncbi:beta-ketoacyl-ACP synthase 3 [Lyticum sinuosum]|uniref:3-oxoacyl-[acyl-carrier-protein] synthase 3 n=1 Tax=Lyticum sinuosum TaxID=1332059 RepID=A0AAE4VKW9_9RICK|nr:beta-ketoacyl-ACP synthase 3 [Lyticum sinuosum]MDZ5761348.1 3-oxoacyl-[acyl-carrier-protein] synthase 3 [Lyticum sinuosum]